MTTPQEKLRLAIDAGDAEALRALMRQGVPLPADEPADQLPSLFRAAAGGHAEVVALLLAAGASVNRLWNNGFTALHAAAMQGHTAVVARLLDAGARPNAQTRPQGYAPLHSAAFAGHDATVDALLARGALTGLLNYHQEKPAMTARRTGHEATAARIEAAAQAPAVSPRLSRFEWGRIDDVAGRTFKDVRLFPGGAEAWDWRRTGTRHDPGIQVADLEDLLETRPEVAILSRGVDLVLQVSNRTVEAVRSRVPEVCVLQSEDAVAEYNRRASTQRVVALIHSTC